jgi:lauroyl/myristoyl acyltransferase
MRRIRYRIEYIALRVAAGLCLALPHSAALAFAWIAAGVGFHVVRFRRAEAVWRIVSVFGDAVTPRQAEWIAWRSWRNLFFNVAEMMRVTRISPVWLRRHVEGLDEVLIRMQTLIEEHGGLVIAVPHMGNWDLAGVAGKQAGVDIFSIAGKQKNPHVNRWLNHIRSHSMDVLERGSSVLRVILRRLQHRGVFAILPDVRMPAPDLLVPFLGTQANLGRGMAQFARTANVPILPVILSRVGWFRHRVVAYTPVVCDPTADRDADLLRMTRTVMEHVEAAIRQTPEQWFWYNKRWVLRPLPARPDVLQKFKF